MWPSFSSIVIQNNVGILENNMTMMFKERYQKSIILRIWSNKTQFWIYGFTWFGPAASYITSAHQCWLSSRIWTQRLKYIAGKKEFLAMNKPDELLPCDLFWDLYTFYACSWTVQAGTVASDLRSSAGLTVVSIWVGDHLESPKGLS